MTVNLMGRKGITIFSDASVFHKKKLSGYGVWAKGDGRDPLILKGKIDPYEQSVTTCELIGLYAGLVNVCKSYLENDDSYILLQSDSTQALGVIKTFAMAKNHPHSTSAKVNHYRKAKSRLKKGALAINRLRIEYKIDLYIRHVRGHNPGGGRNYINRLLDNLAKEAANS